ncbi:unnamed protein product, partial [Prorocentrum cordatum]
MQSNRFATPPVAAEPAAGGQRSTVLGGAEQQQQATPAAQEKFNAQLACDEHGFGPDGVEARCSTGWIVIARAILAQAAALRATASSLSGMERRRVGGVTAMMWRYGRRANLDVNYCVAARLASRLKGAARRVGLRIPKGEATEADSMRSISNVLAAQEAALGGQCAVRRGETMSDFFKGARYNRRAGERIADFVARFEEGVQRFGDDGLRFADQDYILGWCFLEKRCLSPERREWVVAAFPGDKYSCRDVTTIVVRLFRTYTCQHQRFGQRRPGPAVSGSSIRGVNATEIEGQAEDRGDEQQEDDDYADGFEEHEHEVKEVDVSEIQRFARRELEALATELEDSTLDLPPEDSAALEEAAPQISHFTEALEVIRDARGRIQGRAGGGGKAKGKDRGKPGDPESKAPRTTLVTAAAEDSGPAHDALSVEQVKVGKGETMEVLRNELIQKAKDHLRGVVDTACVISAMGDVWRGAYLEASAELGISSATAARMVSYETFRFPAVVASVPVMARACVAKSAELSLLLGRDFLEATGAGIDVARRKLAVPPGSQPWLDFQNCHFALEIKPEKYRALSEAHADRRALPPKLGHRARPPPPPRRGAGASVLKVFAIAATTRCSEARVNAAAGDGRRKQDKTNGNTTIKNATEGTWILTTDNITSKGTPTGSITHGACLACCGTRTLYECQADSGAEFAVQRQSWRRLRNGTIAQHKAGLGRGLQAGDLLEQAARSEAGRAGVPWGSLPCGPWAALQNLAKNNAQLPFERAQNRHVIRLFAREAQRALEVGAIVAFGWPFNCRGWRQPEDRTGKAIEKPWKVIANCQPLQKFLSRRCSQDHGHLHGREFNRKTSRKTRLYTMGPCWAAIKDFIRGIADVNYALATLLNDEENEGMGKGPQGIPASLEPEQRLTPARAVAKMRANL